MFLAHLLALMRAGAFNQLLNSHPRLFCKADLSLFREALKNIHVARSSHFGSFLTMFFQETLDFGFLGGFFLNIQKVNKKVNMENEAKIMSFINICFKSLFNLSVNL